MKRILLLCLIVLTTLSCTLQDHVTPADTCKLVQFVNVNGTNDFTYDATGGVSKWLITRPLANGTAYVVNYDFTRDATGRISSLNQTITDAGVVVGTATAQFTYTNGLLTSTSTSTEPGKPATISRTFTYDNDGRMIKRVVTDTKSSYSSTETYEYDSRGNCTKYNQTNTFGYKEERVFTYDNSKNPEQLLTKSIPFNLLTGLPWSVNVAVTSKATFDYGKGPETDNSTRSNVKTGANGYVTSATETFDNDGYVSNETYTLTGCQ